MKVWVVVGVWSGCLDTVRVFTDEAVAKRAERRWCRDYGIAKENASESDHSVGVFECEIERVKP